MTESTTRNAPLKGYEISASRHRDVLVLFLVDAVVSRQDQPAGGKQDVFFAVTRKARLQQSREDVRECYNV